eukprot:973393_1
MFTLAPFFDLISSLSYPLLSVHDQVDNIHGVLVCVFATNHRYPMYPSTSFALNVVEILVLIVKPQNHVLSFVNRINVQYFDFPEFGGKVPMIHPLVLLFMCIPHEATPEIIINTRVVPYVRVFTMQIFNFNFKLSTFSTSTLTSSTPSWIRTNK